MLVGHHDALSLDARDICFAVTGINLNIPGMENTLLGECFNGREVVLAENYRLVPYRICSPHGAGFVGNSQSENTDSRIESAFMQNIKGTWVKFVDSGTSCEVRAADIQCITPRTISRLIQAAG